MAPDNLPTMENNYESDWWILEKASIYIDFKQNRFLNFFNSSQFKKWWKFSLPTTIIFFVVLGSLVFAHQHRVFLSDLFPRSNSIIALTVQKTKTIPDFFINQINTRYNLSSAIISLKKISGLATTPPAITAEKVILEKPIKILINKIGVKAIVTNPRASDLETLNELLKLGAVRYPTSGLLGEDKNIFIFGHSTGLETENEFYKTFNNLNLLSAGDEIILYSANNKYLYIITSIYETNTAEGIVRFDEEEKKLTLSTCNTLGTKEERYIAEADFVRMEKIITVQNDENNEGVSPNNNNRIIPQAGERENNIYETDGLFVPIIDSVSEQINGQVDLSGVIDAVGILGTANEFIATSTLRITDKIAVQFTVTNSGSKKSDSWYFNAVLPTNPFYIFHSKYQQSLAPGEKIEFTIGFDKPKAGENQVIVINIDPAGGIKESDKSNNIIKEYITIIE